MAKKLKFFNLQALTPSGNLSYSKPYKTRESALRAFRREDGRLMVSTLTWYLNGERIHG